MQIVCSSRVCSYKSCCFAWIPSALTGCCCWTCLPLSLQGALANGAASVVCRNITGTRSLYLDKALQAASKTASTSLIGPNQAAGVQRHFTADLYSLHTVSILYNQVREMHKKPQGHGACLTIWREPVCAFVVQTMLPTSISTRVDLCRNHTSRAFSRQICAN